MVTELPNVTMANPWIVAVMLAILAGIGLNQDRLRGAVLSEWEYLAVGAVGAYIGWSYDVAAMMGVIPLI